MKELVLIIRPDKLETIKEILNTHGFTGITISSVMGCGVQRGLTQEYKGLKTTINLLPKIKVEAIVANEKVEDILLDVHAQVATGHAGDGKVFVKPIDDAMRIRTGERGEKAL